LKGGFVGFIGPVWIGLGPLLQRQKIIRLTFREGMPKLFCDVGHQWVQHHQQRFQAVGQHPAGGAAGGNIFAAKPGFCPFDVLIAEIIPGKFVEQLRCFSEAVTAVELGRLAAGAGQP
jgi:hypothetical protein